MSEPICLLGKKLKLHQPENGFKTGLDAVMLAAACPVKPGQRLLDMGCGVGAAGFCVQTRVGEVALTGVDIQASHIELARENAALNGLGAVFLHADIREYTVENTARFDAVICNPPYLEAGTYLESPKAERATALGHTAEDISIEDWIAAAHRLLKNNGSLSMIHRADFLDKIIVALGRKFGAVEVIPLWPRAGQAAKRVILRAIKDRHSPLILHPGIVLHEGETYTAEAEEILRDGMAI